MVNNLPTLRGDVKKLMRMMIERGLDLRRPALTEADIAHNLAIYKRVHPNGFHCTVSIIYRAHIDSLL
jgi:hypothetical protein